MKTFASLFTGFGGADFGAIAAGLVPIWGIEKDPNVGNIGHFNLSKRCPPEFRYQTRFQDVRETDWSNQKPVDWLHASPPCVRASTANNGKETPEDMELAEAICRAIQALKPQCFSLENVAGYGRFKAFECIQECLKQNEYYFNIAVVDAADFGVPQNRVRLFLIATKKLINPAWFIPIGIKKVSWHEAIADLILIPELKETTLTGWQKQALLNKFYAAKLPNLIIQRSGARKKNGMPNNTIRLANSPMFTIKSMGGNVRPSCQQATIVFNGQPLKPDIQCYARWQTFPYDYQFSGDFKLDIKGIGNAVPPLMMEAIINAQKHTWA
jgi:DNA (cytosine-5)-methyltransferase 1